MTGSGGAKELGALVVNCQPCGFTDVCHPL